MDKKTETTIGFRVGVISKPFVHKTLLAVRSNIPNEL